MYFGQQSDELFRGHVAVIFEVPPRVLRVLNAALFLLHSVFALFNRHQHRRVHRLLLFFVLVFDLAHQFFEGLEAAMLAHINFVLDRPASTLLYIFAFRLLDSLHRKRVGLIALKKPSISH